MIVLIKGEEYESKRVLLDQVFRARAEIFSHRMGWHVSVSDGMERDHYDDLNPLYILALRGRLVAGSLRLLPTTGPTMMRSDFAQMFPEVADIRSPTIWECTRFCLHPGFHAAESRGVSSEMMIGICETALAAGAEHILGVFDTGMIRVYRRVGWEPDRLAEGVSETGRVFVGLWEVSERALNEMKKRRSSLIASSEVA